MRIFLDTSSLIKKYAVEEGSDDLEMVLKEATEIIVSPITWIESRNSLSRMYREKIIDQEECLLLRNELKKDFNFFNRVLWSDALEEKAIEIVEERHLKTLDSIQLAAGILSNADLFVSSDKKLLAAAKKVLKNVRGISS